MLIGVLALLLLLAVGPTPRADAKQPLTVNVVTGVNYNGSPGTSLDLHVPVFPGKSKLPLVIWSNGCAWLLPNCGRTGTNEIAAEFNPQGYAVAGVGIAGTLTLPSPPFPAPQAFPTQLYDIRAAIRWLRQNASTYNLDPDRFAIMGFSSGGWTAVIAGTTSDEAALPGEPNTNGLSTGVSSAVQAAVGFSSPTDFLQMDQWHNDHPDVPDAIVHDAPLTPLPPPPPPWGFPAASPESLLVRCTDGLSLFGIQHQSATLDCQARTRAANPITYVEGSEAPTLLLHGFVDPLVPHGQSELLYDALAAAGNEVIFISVAGAGHSPQQIRDGEEFTVFHTDRGGRETIKDRPAPTWRTIEHFIHVWLKSASGR
jgi:acetyl esterase/lipase